MYCATRRFAECCPGGGPDQNAKQNSATLTCGKRRPAAPSAAGRSRHDAAACGQIRPGCRWPAVRVGGQSHHAASMLPCATSYEPHPGLSAVAGRQSPVRPPDYRRPFMVRIYAAVPCLRRNAVEWTREPALSELLGDPITRALMVADHVEQNDLDVLIGTVRCQRRRYLTATPDDRGVEAASSCTVGALSPR